MELKLNFGFKFNNSIAVPDVENLTVNVCYIFSVFAKQINWLSSLTLCVF